MHDTAVTMVIIQRVVKGTAVVPDSDRADFPLKTAGKFRLDCVVEKKLQNRFTLLPDWRPASKHTVAAIDIQRLSASFGMRADYRVDRFCLYVGSILQGYRRRFSAAPLPHPSMEAFSG